MKANKHESLQGMLIRLRAEEELAARLFRLPETISEDAARVIHELQLHQIELELQNEDLGNMQAEFQESRNRYLDLFYFSPASFFILDSNNIILDTNLFASKLLGCKKKNLLNKRFVTFIEPEFQDVFNIHQNQIKSNHGMHSCELKMKKENGSSFLAHLDSWVMKDQNGGFIHLYTAAIDVTMSQRYDESVKTNIKEYTTDLVKSNQNLIRNIIEPYQAKEALPKGEEMFRLLVEASPLAIVVSDSITNKNIYVNHKFTQDFGYTLEDIPDIVHWWAMAYPDEEYRKQVVEHRHKNVEFAKVTGSETEPMETVVICKDGSKKSLNSN